MLILISYPIKGYFIITLLYKAALDHRKIAKGHIALTWN